jgi:endogenous inhibitor of DNA gyrase (YacG/DUF329 family)
MSAHETRNAPDATPRIVACPTCRKRVKWTPRNEFRPFCSERCKLIDLGAWADEKHSIPGDSDLNDLSSGDLDQP